jgi:hypothetical protein
MSLRSLQDFTSELPFAIAEQVYGYARSVREAAPDICRDAEIEPSETLSDQLMWLAAVKRLHSIIGSAYWTVENANHLLRQQDAGPPFVGATDYSDRSSMYATLARLQLSLQQLEHALGVADLIHLRWPDVVRILADERRGG